jgi:hypothetical protein
MKRTFSTLFAAGGLLISASAFAANVGYYDMSAGQGAANQVAPITTAGHTAVNIVDLSPAELSGIDVLMVQNPSNGGYGAEYLGALTDIEAAVNAGMRLVIHDRFVTDAETILPDSAGFDIIRDFTDDANIDILDNTTLVTNGPGGTLDDSSLDGGTSSSHGFAVQGTLPAGSVFILSRTIDEEIVTFSYPFGSGSVLYSSIPLDYYLNGSGSVAAFADIYAVNVVAYAVDGMEGSVTGTAYFKVLKTFSNGDNGDVEVTLTCNGGIPLQQSFTISGGGPGVTFTVTNLPDAGADCAVTESGGNDGYTAVMNGGSGCAWTGMTGGLRTCEIENIPDATTVTVETTVDTDDDAAIDPTFTTTIVCDNVSEDTGPVFGTVTVEDTSGTFTDNWYADPVNGTDCTVTLVPNDMAVEGSTCSFSFAIGDETAGCDVEGTVFFEGIPTLSQYGLAIMALLMLGIGFVGFRRFV